MASFELPPEILTLVFGFLDEFTLDTVALVCRAWNDAAGDSAWKRLFEHRFLTSDVAPLTGPTSTWRREYLARTRVLAKWAKGTRSSTANVSYNAGIWDVTDLFVDFAALKVICFNIHRGIGNISDPRLGKVPKKRIYASRHSHQLMTIACVDGSRFGLVYGFYDGHVAAVTLTKDAVVSDYHEMVDRHSAEVSCVWISKSEQFSEVIPGICIASASRDGSVHLLVGPRDASTKVPQRFKHQVSEKPIVRLEATPDFALVVDSAGFVFIVRDGAFEKVVQLPLSHIVDGMTTSLPDDVKQLFILSSTTAIARTTKTLYIVHIADARYEELEIPTLQKNEAFEAFAVDKRPRVSQRHVALATANGVVSVWRVPGPPWPIWSHLHCLPPDSHVQESGRPPVTNLALNSVVLLESGYNGLTTAVDVLTGTPLRQVSDKIPKSVLDFTPWSPQDGLVPVTKLEVDPNPFGTQGVISVKLMAQYFDLSPGSAKAAKALQQRYVRSLTQGRQSNTAGNSNGSYRAALDQEILEEMDVRIEEMYLAEREESQENRLQHRLQQRFGVRDLEEEEQLAYAMALSQENQAEDDEDLRRALELSRLETTQLETESTAPVSEQETSSRSTDVEDEDLLRALALSLETM